MSIGLNWDTFMSGENEGMEDIPLETAEQAVIEGEVVEAAEEIETDVQEFEQFDDNTDALIEDAEELEAVKDGLDEQLEDPQFEGIDEFAAEMIGNRIARMGRDRKMDFGSLTSTYSKETFGSNINNRRERTVLASEGLGDAIKSMWEKIKAAIKAAVDYVKDFFKKHISTVGRLIKALEKTKKRARDVKGSPDASKEVKVSSALQNAFYVSGNLGTEEVAKVISNHDEAMMDAIRVIEKTKAITDKIDVAFIGKVTNGADASAAANMFTTVKKEVVGTFGSQDKLLVGGVFGKIETTDKENGVSVNVVWDERKAKASKEAKVAVGQKSALEGLCASTIEVLNKTQQMGKVVDKATDSFNKSMNDLNKYIGTIDEGISTEGRKALNGVTNGLRDVVRAVPKVSTRLVRENVKLARSVNSFVGVSLGNYKAA